MPEPATLALFSVAAFALIAVPGPAVLYIVARSVAHGARAGVVSAFGVALGGLVHAAAAVAGLSALLVSSAEAFTAVKYAGAAYLVHLGIRQLRGRAAGGAGFDAPHGAAGVELRRVFWQGALVNLLNPKTAVFFLAFLPQFVDPGAGSAATQTMVLGIVFVAIAVVSDSLWAVIGGGAVRRLSHAARRRVERYGSGSVLVALGAGTAVSAARGSG